MLIFTVFSVERDVVFKNVESETPLSLKKVRSYHTLFVRIIITLLNRFRLVEYAHL